MDFYDVVNYRRSIRSYRKDPVPDDALERIAKAASAAPSACNRQPVRLVAVKSPDKLARLYQACPMKFIAEAPMVLLALGNPKQAWQRPGDDHSIVEVDLGIMFEHVILAAEAEGLATCWVCAYTRANVDAALEIPAPWTVLALSPLGYANADPLPFNRKPLAETFEII